MTQPSLWIVAGANGSGKSTLVDRYFQGRIAIVNPDNIARDTGVSAIQAGRTALLQQNDLLAAQKSFLIETTLSGKREVPFIEFAKNQGYKIKVVFVAVPNAQVAIGRVAERVAVGGHHVPTADIRRRFDRNLVNAMSVLTIADRAWIIDNSSRRGRLLLSMERGKIKFESSRMPKWALGIVVTQATNARGLSR